ncbi:UNKNOWN [Stylonychia lemnae]|uniref:TLDc domain-containing protein n=1 Tax=Stylonychia lemnae TaxID=5949 RepID=A0A078B556_STYLE|nr:UNKNOWN [Stylonychia lemnae]|eukprot:CDW89660.1 UNKNOWN [Stylonychia lemnae]
MLPCGDLICLSCFQTLLEPQESKLICPVDKETLIISQKFREKVQKITKQQQELLWISCQQHIDLIAEYYCNIHRELVCHQCVHKSHRAHAQKLDHVVAQDIQEFCERALIRLKERRGIVTDLIQEVENYNQLDKSYPAEIFVKILKGIQDELLPHLDKKGKKELQLKMNRKANNDISEESMALFNITDDHEDLLKEWIHGEDEAGNTQLELLYKGTRDTFNSSKMHEMINDKGPIVGIIKSQHDQVFGGYSSVGWKNAGDWTRDENAFLFSLTKKTKHEQYQQKEQALYFAASYMLWFSYDMLLYSNCDSNTSSSSSLGTTYKLPDGIVQGSVEGQNYLAGSSNYSVKEIEIYRVILEQ